MTDMLGAENSSTDTDRHLLTASQAAEAAVAEAAPDDYAAVGRAIRAARLALGISLRALSERANVSPSLLSAVENERSIPTVASLVAISTALGLPPQRLFPPPWRDTSQAHFASNALEPSAPPSTEVPAVEPLSPTPSPTPSIITPEPTAAMSPTPVMTTPRIGALGPAQRPTIETTAGIRWARLSADATPGGETLMLTLYPGATTGPTLVQHPGRDIVYMMSGEMLLDLGFESMILSAGMSLSFDAMIPHRVSNIAGSEATAIWITLGPSGARP